jgi:hypothetical protein
MPRKGANPRQTKRGPTEQDPLFAFGMVKRAGTLTEVSKRAVKSRSAERALLKKRGRPRDGRIDRQRLT